MFAPLGNRTYRHLFFAQILALLGTGLMTVALGLLAWDLAGDQAAMVLGTALAIKMVAYVTIAPVAQALSAGWPRRKLLISLDLVRASVALLLPFVTEVWQIYLLIFVLQAASAAFTPTFQALIPEILHDEGEYTKALSLARLAYDLEALISPVLAAALLTVVSFSTLFSGTILGFLASAMMIASVTLPKATSVLQGSVWDRTTRGLALYLATPRLRGLFAVNFTVAAAGSMVIVNTVVIVQTVLGLSQSHVAGALAAFGVGSMLAALILPRILARYADRTVMMVASAVMIMGLLAGITIESYTALLLLWALLGFGYSAAQLPAGRLLRGSGDDAERPGLFAAQFTLSHAAWLLCYPLAGLAFTTFGMSAAFIALAIIGALALTLAINVW